MKITKIAEIPVFQAMADGKVDAILEDWQHTDEYKQYVTKQKSVVRIGGNGVTGIIGWFIPKYLLDQYPTFKNWSGLKGKESIFKSPESGSQGMFLGGDPSYVQKDKELIAGLAELQARPVGPAGGWRAGRSCQAEEARHHYVDPVLTQPARRVKLPKRFAAARTTQAGGNGLPCVIRATSRS